MKRIIFITQRAKLNVIGFPESNAMDFGVDQPICKYSNNENSEIVLLHDGYLDDKENTRVAAIVCDYLNKVEAQDTFIIYHTNMESRYNVILKDRFKGRIFRDLHQEKETQQYGKLKTIIQNNAINQASFDELYEDLERIFNGKEELSVLLNSLYGILGTDNLDYIKEETIKSAITNLQKIPQVVEDRNGKSNRFEKYKNAYKNYVESEEDKIEKLRILRDSLLGEII